MGSAGEEAECWDYERWFLDYVKLSDGQVCYFACYVLCNLRVLEYNAGPQRRKTTGYPTDASQKSTLFRVCAFTGKTCSYLAYKYIRRKLWQEHLFSAIASRLSPTCIEFVLLLFLRGAAFPRGRSPNFKIVK